jgi:alpha-ketoglutarate-dependent taurine dioxygenase
MSAAIESVAGRERTLSGVRIEPLNDAKHGFPLCIRAIAAPLTSHPKAVAEWVSSHQSILDETLDDAGAVLFRGFALPDATAFDGFMSSYPVFLGGYSGGTSTRNTVTGRVMESTVAPPDRVIPIHQEMAYSVRYPMKIAFFCELAPSLGGETPVCDMRELDRRVPRALYEKVRERGLIYNRFFRSRDWQTGIPRLDIAHRTWQDALGTDDPRAAEREVERLGSEFEWVQDGIIVRNLNSGFATHPHHGDSIWFNQAAGLSLAPSVIGAEMASLFEQYYADHHPVPYWVSFGDGRAIPIEDIEPLLAITDGLTVVMPWRQGDVMLLDNIYAGHGRKTFAGERKIRVALVGADP